MTVQDMGFLRFFTVQAEIRKEIDNQGDSVYNFSKATSGIDRIKLMFQRDEYGLFGPDVQFALHGGMLAFVMGVTIGGIKSNKTSFEDFRRKNQHTLYEDKINFMRAAQDKYAVNMFRGGFKYGVKIATFTSSFILLSSIISNYRGKSSVLDFTIAGFTNGALFRVNMGLKGAFAGGLVGGVLGTFAGLATSLHTLLTGESIDEMRYWHYSISKKYDDLRTESMKKHGRPKEMDSLTLEHEKSSKDSKL